jgi:hypothetical protein
MGRHWRMVEPKATALGCRSRQADWKRNALDANAGRGKANMSNAKKALDRIWAFHDGPLVGYFVGQSPGEGSYVAEFIRADLANTPSPEAIVRAALEVAAELCHDMAGGFEARLIRRLADNPAEVAAIIKKAGEDRG